MSRRGLEFKQYTIDTAYYRSEGKCECCGKSQTEDGVSLEAHHILPIWVANEVGFLSNEVIRSLANCQILCVDCHKDHHRSNSNIEGYFYQIEILKSLDTVRMF